MFQTVDGDAEARYPAAYYSRIIEGTNHVRKHVLARKLKASIYVLLLYKSLLCCVVLLILCLRLNNVSIS